MTRFASAIVRREVAAVALVLGVSLVTATPARSQIVRSATGANAAAIQAAVDLFRADLGGPNNGTTAGSQPAGRREIQWDAGGAGATPSISATPLTTFGNRGAVFVTPGSGFEISGAPSPEFGELNPNYPTYFAPFSAPRLFTALNSNVMEVHFKVPGNIAVPAAVTGFGAVFTDVDSATSTKMEFYAPDGALLYENFVAATSGDASLSFLGVSFPAGEVVSRVRIISGNAAPGPPGPDETGSLDVVVMDDFIYGEPVSTQGLTIAPITGTLFRQGAFDIVVQLDTNLDFIGGQARLDGSDVSGPFASCVRDAKEDNGHNAFRCPAPRGFLGVGVHVFQLEFTLSDQTRVRNAVRWEIANINQ
jgi:hypothetical protein